MDQASISLKKRVEELFEVTAIRSSIWEEHCLECSAPQCFSSCSLYEPRVDGRCARFENGIETFSCPDETSEGMSARVRFRPWGNMLSIIYPGFVGINDCAKQSFVGRAVQTTLRMVAGSRLPSGLIWPIVRIVEYARRRYLCCRGKATKQRSDAFVLHTYSNHSEPFNLILEVYRKNAPVFRTSFKMNPGENLHLLDRVDYSNECDVLGNTIKIYPENDIKADVIFYWCHFVQGSAVNANKVPDKFVKCLVWDLDHTLWQGILIECDDPSMLCLKESVLRTIKELDQRGILQSIASKNDFEPAMEQLERLKVAEFFLYPQINWEPKSQSMSRIAEALNINLDSLAFVDDSAFEREQVVSQFPQVRVYDESQVADLVDMPPFCVEVTSESAKRRESYKTELVRKKARSEKTLDLSAFIRECEVEITIFRPTVPSEVERCFELVQRTNQLNISGRKYTRSEFEGILSSNDRKTIAFSCKDKFGEYGTVCFAQYEIKENELIFLEFAMSCRVAGKHIENAFFNTIRKTVDAEGYQFPVKKTPKNGLMRRTLSAIGLPAVEESEDRIVYEFGGTIMNSDDVRVAACEED